MWDNVSFDASHLQALLAKHGTGYRSAQPFPHVIMDEGLLHQSIFAAIASEIPERILGSGCVPGAAACYRKRGVHWRKSELHHESMGPHTRALFAALRSDRFVHFLERLSGIRPLIPDPGYQGSGVHLTGSGGILKVHNDFNFMLCRRVEGSGRTRTAIYAYADCMRGSNTDPAGQRVHRLHRRVNVFFYLNPNWPEHFGGHLELWSSNMSACHRRIAPSFGRFVAFSSTDFSFHGHPEPMVSLPEDRLRRSIAFYYYSAVDRPASECSDGDCHSFHDASWQDPKECERCAACLAHTSSGAGTL